MTTEDRRRSTGFLIAFALAYAGGVIAYLPLLALLLPIKVEGVASATRIDLLTAAALVGAVAASLANILFGWLSDRSVARGHSRRGWIVGGLAATALSYAALLAADTPATVMAGVAAFQVALNAALAPLVATMADEVPDAQKGVVGGLLGLANPLASGVSALLVLVQGEGVRYALVCAVATSLIVPLLLTRARAVAEPPASGVAVARRDLAIAWGARLLVQVAGNVLFLYLLFYFESVVPASDAAGLAPAVGHVMTMAFALPLPIAVLVGWLSDRSGARKPWLLAAALVSAAGLATMAVASDWTSAVVGFGIYAAGSAVFLGLHQALAMQLLPSPTRRGRDLGLLNLTNTLPALIGPALAWWLATPQSFSALLIVLCAMNAGGGLLVLAVRGRG
jgi:MFS family permease